MEDGYSEELISEILRKHPGMTMQELERLVEEKVKEFGGIIRRDAALLLVAKELGVVVPREKVPRSLSTLKVRDLAAGFRGVDLEGYVIERSSLGLTKEGKPYLRFLLTDGEDVVRVVAWDDAAKAAAGVSVGARVLLRKVSVAQRRGRLEVVLGRGSSLEVKEPPSLSSLSELLSRFKARTEILEARKVFKEVERTVLFCLDRGCNPVCLVLPPGIEVPEGSFILSNFSEERFRGLRVLRYGRECFLEVLRGRVGECSPAALQDLVVRGRVIGYLLFGKPGGKLFLLCEDEELLDLAIFSDAYLSSAKKFLGREVEVWGVTRGKTGLVASQFLQFLPLDEQARAPELHYVEKPLLVAAGPVSVRATLLSLRLRSRCLDGEPLFHILALVDDGTASVQALSNSSSVLRELYGIEEKDLCEMGGEAMGKISDYIAGELRGADLHLEGLLVGAVNKLLLIHRVKVL
uniref:OB domain-containing protein n=1 Tax=Thermofilum pendens TaxID=2269 RepID=A0A7C4B9N6_THEPE